MPRLIDLFGPEYGKIQMVQVTLDGDRSYHDSQRIPLSGKPTFDDMISSLRMLKKTGAAVLIRVHTHPQRMHSASELVKYLDKEKITGGNVWLYFSPLNDFTSCSTAEASEFRRIFQNVSKKTGSPPVAGMNFLKHLIEMQEEKILPKTRFCSAGSDALRIIDPLGDIYDCYEDAGIKERRIGSLSGGKVRFFASRRMYSNRHILNIPECLRCSLALFCGGGCAAGARAQTGSVFEPHCHQNRELIAETLKAYFITQQTRHEGASHATQIH